MTRVPATTECSRPRPCTRRTPESRILLVRGGIQIAMLITAIKATRNNSAAIRRQVLSGRVPRTYTAAPWANSESPYLGNAKVCGRVNWPKRGTEEPPHQPERCEVHREERTPPIPSVSAARPGARRDHGGWPVRPGQVPAEAIADCLRPAHPEHPGDKVTGSGPSAGSATQPSPKEGCGFHVRS